MRRKLILVTLVCSVKWRNAFFLRHVQGLSFGFDVRVGIQKKYQLHTRRDIWKIGDMTGSGAESLEVCHGITEKNRKVRNSNLGSHFFRRDKLMKNKLWRSLLFTWLPMVRYPFTMQFSFNFILFYPRLVHACLLIRSSPCKAGKRSMYCFNF